MAIKIILGFIITLYSTLSLFAFLSNKRIKASAFSVAVCVISCALIFASNVGLVINKDFFAWTLCSGLLLLWIRAIMNGFLLHKRPNWSHHIIRLSLSVVIFVLYIRFV